MHSVNEGILEHMCLDQVKMTQAVDADDIGQ